MEPGHLMLRSAEIPPGEEWSCDSPGWAFVRVAGGIGYRLRPGPARDLTPGDVIVSPIPARIVYRASQMGSLFLHYFRLAPELLDGFFTLTEEHYLEAVAPLAAQPILHCDARHPVGLQFQSLVEDSTADPIILRSRMLALVATVLADSSSFKLTDDSPPRAAANRFHDLIARLPAGEFQHWPLSRLAAVCGCSARHFSRLFRERFGASIRARNSERRLLRARRLLASPGADIQRIAHDCGFRRLPVFTRLFEQRFGLTPSQWQAQNGVRTTVEPSRDPS